MRIALDGLVVLVLGLWTVSESTLLAQDAPVNEAAARVRLDDLGDPLPAGAVRRFGTIRFHHPGVVHELEVSPDDRLVATMGRELIVWDSATGKELWRSAPGEWAEFSNAGYGKRMIAFSPDSRLIYRATHPRGAAVFDTATGRPTAFRVADRLGQPAAELPDRIATSIDLSADGRFVAIGSDASIVVSDLHGVPLYELANNREVPFAQDEEKDRLTFGGAYAYGKFSPEGTLLAAATSDRPKQLRLYDAETGALQRTVQLQSRPVQFAFSRDGIHVAVSERDHAVRLYETATARRVWEHPVELTNPYENYTSSIAYSTDGAFIAVGATDKRIYILDAHTGNRRGRLEGHGWYPWGIGFSGDSKTLYSSGWEGRIRRWDAPSLKQLPLPAGIAGSSVIAISPEGSWIAFADDGGTVHLVDARRQVEVRQLKSETTDYSQLAFSPDGRLLAAGGTHGTDVTLHLWRTEDGGLEREWNWPKGKDPHSHVEDLAFTPDGKRLASAVFRQSSVQNWNLEDGTRLADLTHRQVYGLSFSPDGKTLATAGWDRCIRFWDAVTLDSQGVIDLKELVDEGDSDLRMYTIRFDPTGRLFATAHLQNGMVRVWDAQTRKPLRVLNALDSLHFGALAFSPDGRWLATGGAGGRIELFDAATGRMVAEPGRHAHTVYTLGFGADSRTLVSGGNDGVGYLWEVAVPVGGGP